MALPRLTDEFPLTLEPTPKHIRAIKDGKTVVDSRRAQMVRLPFPPPRTYAVPREDVQLPGSCLVEAGDYVAVQWDAVDHWYEESEEVFIHPRDPRQRIDVLATKRHIEVLVDGTVIADSNRTVMLIEAWPNLPVRYYFPHDDVNMSRLRASETTSGCPYKGFASYFDVQGDDTWYENLVWTYSTPFREVDPIRGRLCFFNERVDMRIDGVKVERPQTPFS